MNYEIALVNGWNHLLAWVKKGKFKPANEEDVQCFLCHGLVSHLQDARGIRSKASSGNLPDNTKHFPDLVLGSSISKPQVVVEIKFQTKSPHTVYLECRRDIQKLKKYYDSVPHYFVLFDANPDHVFLDQHQLTELSSLASKNCRILHYPKKLSTSPGKGVARSAIANMRAKGLDLSENAKKAVANRKKNAV